MPGLLPGATLGSFSRALRAAGTLFGSSFFGAGTSPHGEPIAPPFRLLGVHENVTSSPFKVLAFGGQLFRRKVLRPRVSLFPGRMSERRTRHEDELSRSC